MSTANSTSSADPKVAAIRRQVKLFYNELSALLDSQVRTLYVGKLYQAPIENEWTIMENLVHIAEMMSYWADEVAKLAARPGQKFGRTKEDLGRLAALREHSHDSLAQVKATLPGSYARLEEALSSLRDSDLELTGCHSVLGEQTLEWFIEEFITRHLRDHIVQIQQCLAVVE